MDDPEKKWLKLGQKVSHNGNQKCDHRKFNKRRKLFRLKGRGKYQIEQQKARRKSSGLPRRQGKKDQSKSPEIFFIPTKSPDHREDDSRPSRYSQAAKKNLFPRAGPAVDFCHRWSISFVSRGGSNEGQKKKGKFNLRNFR
jgi:hypothetical protein